MIIGLPDLYLSVKKGSKKFKKVLLKNKKLKVKPWITINDKWNISGKNGRENYFEKVFSLWKKPYLPAKLQNFCLLHVNNRYNYNTQLNKYKKDEKGETISDKCTFCKLLDPHTAIRESKEHIYTGCPASLSVLTRLAERYSIKLPSTQDNGELILYYLPMTERWVSKGT